ncbi:tetratricopeptide repeat protein, partial [Streptomyces chartreusis]|uniref:tetratricopeptide repeat protein n=1 Tax=Streptomyces chartreusis TaxID=1969 RepID=UPI0036909CFD
MLTGMGGSGKTALALELAYRSTAQGYRVWWVDGRQSAELQAGLRAVAINAGAAEKELHHAHPADVLWHHLDRQDQPWLLVMDGVDDLKVLGDHRGFDGTGWVRPHTRGLGTVLITTRDGSARHWRGLAVLHEVHTLSGDAIDYGTRILLDAAPLGSAEDARRLAERLGGLPLALHLAGTYLAKANNMLLRPPTVPTDFASYLDALNHNPHLVDPGNVIRQTWAMSVDLLEKRGEPLARPLLELIATFADAPVPYALLLKPENLTEAGDLAGLDGHHLWRLLTDLDNFGLIDLAPLPKDVAGTVPALRVHPLVRDAGSNPSALGTAIRIVRTAALDAETGNPEMPAFWDQWRLLQPHALDLFHRALTTGLPDSVVVNAASAAGLAARHLQSRGLYQPARAEFEAILAVRRQALGDTHPDTLTARHELAVVLGEQGEWARARAEFEAILAVRRQALGDTHPDTLTARHELAVVLGEQGEWARARAEFE